MISRIVALPIVQSSLDLFLSIWEEGAHTFAFDYFPGEEFLLYLVESLHHLVESLPHSVESLPHLVESLSHLIDWVIILLITLGGTCLEEKEKWAHWIIPLVFIIILGQVWIDSITVNVTFLKPIREIQNGIVTQISRIWTPEVQLIISVITCIFFCYIYIKRNMLALAPLYYIAHEYLVFGFIILCLRFLLQWFGALSAEGLYISVLSKLFINPVQKFLGTVFEYVEKIFSSVFPGKTFPLKGMSSNMAVSLTLLICINGTQYTEQYCPASFS
tara:strand:- start:1344 stop:2165 length:822 start_codon:yes stop_codon:yes gene_type:complete